MNTQIKNPNEAWFIYKAYYYNRNKNKYTYFTLD